LTAVSLFHGVADAQVLGLFSDMPDVPERFRGHNEDDWADLLDQAAAVGLLTALGAGMYRIHPALPAYLAARWRNEQPDRYEAERAAVDRALLDAHAAFGQWLVQQINAGDAGLAFSSPNRSCARHWWPAIAFTGRAPHELTIADLDELDAAVDASPHVSATQRHTHHKQTHGVRQLLYEAHIVHVPAQPAARPPATRPNSPTRWPHPRSSGR
jgi:hypothetical protein